MRDLKSAFPGLEGYSGLSELMSVPQLVFYRNVKFRAGALTWTLARRRKFSVQILLKCTS